MNRNSILLLLSLIFLFSCEKKEKQLLVTTKSQFADFEGNAINLKDFKGQRVLINFWATWCAPCLEEMPSMVKAQELLQNEGYVFLFATTDKAEKVQAFKKNNDYPFTYIKYNSTLDKLNIHALPATLVYNKEGRLSKRIDGMTKWDSEEILNQLRAIK